MPDEGPIQPSTQYMGGRTDRRYLVECAAATETSRQDKLETLMTTRHACEGICACSRTDVRRFAGKITAPRSNVRGSGDASVVAANVVAVQRPCRSNGNKRRLLLRSEMMPDRQSTDDGRCEHCENDVDRQHGINRVINPAREFAMPPWRDPRGRKAMLDSLPLHSLPLQCECPRMMKMQP